jgi:hypothetical protein
MLSLGFLLGLVSPQYLKSNGSAKFLQAWAMYVARNKARQTQALTAKNKQRFNVKNWLYFKDFRAIQSLNRQSFWMCVSKPDKSMSLQWGYTWHVEHAWTCVICINSWITVNLYTPKPDRARAAAEFESTLWECWPENLLRSKDFRAGNYGSVKVCVCACIGDYIGIHVYTPIYQYCR